MNDKALAKPNVAKNDLLKIPLEDTRNSLKSLSAKDRIQWAHQKFGSQFAITTSFGIQSSVLLHMVHLVGGANRIKVIWVDTGYLPAETYLYAEKLINQLNIDIEIVQSNVSTARMEAIYGKLWNSKSEKDVESYHIMRKVKPLEKALVELDIICWASGVRKDQTEHRRKMTVLDPIRERFSLRPILEWTQKDIFYYMEKYNLPQHPLFNKGYSTVGDWHSSGPDTSEASGRKTRFGGLKQECGIHVTEEMEEAKK